jgi:ABC-type nitrate/sulfonate/bicarbonate transport system ATPase subunit
VARIDIEGVHFSFPRNGDALALEVLGGIDLSVGGEEFVVILGPSGCGKSTLLRLVAGLERPSSGLVLVDGVSVSEPSRDRGMVFQAYTSFPWLDVRRNVEFGLRMQGVPAAERERDVERLLDLVGLREFAGALPKELSGGMQQRVALARTLAMNPRILLMDEPFGALDAQTRRSLQEELISIQRETKKTVLFVTHDIEEALLLGTRIVVMASSPGRVVEDRRRSSQRELSREYLLSDEAIVERRRLALLLEQRKLRVAVSESPASEPLLYANREGLLPPLVEIEVTEKDVDRDQSGESTSDVVVLPLAEAVGHCVSARSRIICCLARPGADRRFVLIARKGAVPEIQALASAAILCRPAGAEDECLCLHPGIGGLPAGAVRLETPPEGESTVEQLAEAVLSGRAGAVIISGVKWQEVAPKTVEGLDVSRLDLPAGLFQTVCCATGESLKRKRDLLASFVRLAFDSMGLAADEELEVEAGTGVTAGSPGAVRREDPQGITFLGLGDNVSLLREGGILQDIGNIMAAGRSIRRPPGIAPEVIPSDLIDSGLIASLAAEARNKEVDGSQSR